ncbi:MFS transporter [Carnimonas bestiolae]|uniref:MFS transporter n=1 Tax=Carnimonas bestiolae TaxID=3402172 RepID=UPI003EDB8624
MSSAAVAAPSSFIYWKRNLTISVFGAFTSIIAMTLLIPLLPAYIKELGISDRALISQWSGIAYGATFLSAALVAPLWGRLSDRFGRKLMLVRASLGMTIVMAMMGFAHNVWELVALRLLVGLAGGYSSGANTLVATQTPENRTGWALGLLSAGILTGNLVGPLVGGFLPSVIGIRGTFMVAAGLIFITFLTTLFGMQEDRDGINERRRDQAANKGGWRRIEHRWLLAAMLVSGFLMMVANMSIEPIVALYVGHFVEPEAVLPTSGIVMAATACGGVFSAIWLGRFADRSSVGPWWTIVFCLAAGAFLMLPQAFVTAAWQLIVLRFLMGLALGGLLPCLSSMIRRHVPASMAGSVLGASVSVLYIGQVLGPLAGGYIGGHLSMQAVFILSCVLMSLGVLFNMVAMRRHRPA